MRWMLWAWLAWCPMGRALAADPCNAPLDVAGSHAARIAAVACAELRLWYSPFIDVDGRLASTTVAEGESARLQDGQTPAWRRVADYWRDSGLLGQMASHAGATDCALPQPAPAQQASCRAYILDTPWSAAFVSYVMARIGLPGFASSASHVEFVRRAWRDPASPYRLADPEREPPAQGDLLCYARAPAALGHAGLGVRLQQDPGGGLAMHCDIVVAASPGGDGRLHLVGGNVLQAVTARLLNLNRNGLLWALPRRAPELDCTPANATGCSFNRQDWVALLKLKPLPAPTAPMPATPAAAPQSCCVRCILPMPEGMRRCPAAVDQ